MPHRWKHLTLPVSLLLALLPRALPAQQPRRTENVVLIVTDGLRWQELFRGADSALIDARWGGVEDTAGTRRAFRRPTIEATRGALLPFIWGQVAQQGQIFGNVPRGSVATVTNGLKFSYPGYNEMISGRPDPRIDRNDAGPNPNVTVFEWLNGRAGLKGRVAVFGTWDAFPAIFNRGRSGLPIHAGWEVPFVAHPAAGQAAINRLYATTTRLWDDLAYDGFMQAVVLDYVRARRPRLLFVGYGETDEWAHSRRYDQTLRSAQRVDGFIAELWNTMQGMPQYRGRTTFIITTDHGRGATREDWTDHGKNVVGAENIWIAVIGPDTPAVGEVTGGVRVTQGQIAATIAALLGEDYRAVAPDAAPPLAWAIPSLVPAGVR